MIRPAISEGGAERVATRQSTLLSPRVLVTSALGVLLLFTLLGIWESHLRGIWLDEAWSILEGRRDLSFGEAFLQRWRYEVSPPYFYMASWLVQPIVGDGIFARRLLNLVPLTAAAAAFWTLGRRDAKRVPFLVLLTLLLLSNNLTVAFFPEHRAYFTIIAGSSVIAAALASMFATGADYRRQDRILVGLLLGGMLVVFSLHYIVAFEVGLIVSAMIIVQWLRGMRRWGAALAGAATLASIPIVIAYAVQSSILRQFAQNGWIDTSALAAAMLMVAVLSTLLLPIVAAVISSLPSLRASAMFPARKAYIVASCFAVGLSFATLMLANQIQPLVVDRYLMAYLPFAIAPLTAVAAPVFATNRYFAIGVITLVVGQIALASTTVASEDRWNATARLVEDARDSCPRSPVIAVPYWRFFSGYQVGPNEPEAWRIGMDQTARRFGISFRDAASAQWRTHSSCPTILWVEHFYKLPPPASAVMAAAGLTVSPGLAERAVTRRGDTGFIIILPAH